jgi:hypothetical protein
MEEIGMTNQDKISAVECWQADQTVHPLTCISSKHGSLVPVEKGKEVVLLCTVCGYYQEFIPNAVFEKWKSAKPE